MKEKDYTVTEYKNVTLVEPKETCNIDYPTAYQDGYESELKEHEKQRKGDQGVLRHYAKQIKQLGIELDSTIEMRDKFGRDIDDLEQQIKSMECCGNCGKYEDCLDNENAFYRNKCDKWKQHK